MSNVKTSFFFLVTFGCACLYGGNSNYWGTTGLLRIPSGRLISDGDVRFTFSDSYPYRNYSVTFGFFPFLELNGRIVELTDEKLSGSGWGGYGYYKDKVADFKLNLIHETAFFPSIALGVQDFHGTQLFFNEYIAASKRAGDFDFTLGYGGSLLGSAFKREGTRQRELDGLFGGIEWKVRDNISLMVEYDPTNELALNRGTASSNYNYGALWSPTDWLSCGYSFQRGQRHSFYVALTYPFGKTLIRQEPDSPFYGPVDWTPFPQRLVKTSLEETLSLIQWYLIEEGFPDASVFLSSDMKTLYIEFENRSYLFHGKAAGRALRIAAAQTPEDIEKFCIVLKQLEIPMVEITVSRKDYIDYLNGKISEKDIAERVEISSKISQKHVWWNDGYEALFGSHPSFTYYFEPVKLETYWNDPSGFFQIRMGPTATFIKDLRKGLSLVSYIKFPLYSNISTDTPPISDSPVRSDIVNYLANTGLVLDRLFLNQFIRMGNANYLRFSAGYLEMQYAGVSAEYLRTFRDGRFAFGRELTWAVKRDSDSITGLQGDTSLTSFYNAYIYSPELETTFSLKAGEFLAGDRGARVEVSRDIRGGQVFLWYAKTDTSGLTGPNRNYSDKGVGFALPVRALWPSDTRGHYVSSISPWSRDVGQSVRQVSLYSFLREYTPLYIMNYFENFKE